jgi:co-chaperonin GroES (HSP10)
MPGNIAGGVGTGFGPGTTDKNYGYAPDPLVPVAAETTTDARLPEPIGHRYLVQQDVKVLKSGIIVDDDDSKRLPTGIVLAVGLQSEPLIVVGDRLLFNELSGERYTHHGVEFVVVDHKDVLLRIPA